MGTRTPGEPELDIVLRHYPRTGQNFSSPRDSAMLRMASIRTAEVAFRNENPLVGLVEPGSRTEVFARPWWRGGGGFPRMVSREDAKVAVGWLPTAFTRDDVVLLPSQTQAGVTDSRAKLRVAATTRASISTSCVLRSS